MAEKCDTEAETHDPLIIELVKVLALAAAERDFAKEQEAAKRRRARRQAREPSKG